jgi:hypothetical protein
VLVHAKAPDQQRDDQNASADADDAGDDSDPEAEKQNFPGHAGSFILKREKQIPASVMDR